MANGQAKIYDMITDRICEMLEQGVIPWHKPWRTTDGQAVKNLVSKHNYRGINVPLLSCMGYDSPYWLTYNQAKKLGGHVGKGQKGTPVIFWKWREFEEEVEGKNGTETRKRSVPFLRYYTVFNLEQIEGLPENKIPEAPTTIKPIEPIEECKKIVDGYKNAPEIRHGGNRAYYNPALDLIGMPKAETFESREAYYDTCFHEMVHSTGNTKRLDRPVGVSSFGSKMYSKEELVAEMGAAFLCGESGIEERPLIENQAGYIQSWLQSLRNDRKLVIMAAAQGQKAADHILNRQFQKKEESPSDES